MANSDHNIQTLSTRGISINNCVVYMDRWAEGMGTPTTELGYHATANFNANVDKVIMSSGTPDLIEEVFNGKEGGTLDLEVDNHTYLNYINATGTGLCTTSGGGTWSMGGSVETNKVAIRIKHIMTDGNPYYINIWRATGGGALPLSFTKGGGTSNNKYKISFMLMKQKTVSSQMCDWAGAILPAGAYLLKCTFD